ncbi:MAG: PHP domain-containing protein [Lachnoclostridium sp.]|nr:PHP domain-containing protein [Lachnoclostridium sp.]
MRYSNLHTHTTFSDGKHSLEENVLSAIEKNMISLGFSDHSYTGCDTSYCTDHASYAEYLETIRQLKQTYSEQITLYAGLELDYYSVMSHIPVFTKSLGGGKMDHTYIDRSALGFAMDEIKQYDYLIASVHYIIKDGICYPIDHSPEQQIDCIQNAFNGDIFAMVQFYYDLLCEHVEMIKPTCVGHFDVLTKFSLMPEDDERYREIAEKALRRIVKTCPYIEVNTGAIARGWRSTPYPADYLLKTLLEEGGKPVLGSDSHDKNNLIFDFDRTVDLLKQTGFHEIYVFNGNGFDSYPL